MIYYTTKHSRPSFAPSELYWPRRHSPVLYSCRSSPIVWVTYIYKYIFTWHYADWFDVHCVCCWWSRQRATTASAQRAMVNICICSTTRAVFLGGYLLRIGFKSMAIIIWLEDYILAKPSNKSPTILETQKVCICFFNRPRSVHNFVELCLMVIKNPINTICLRYSHIVEHARMTHTIIRLFCVFFRVYNECSFWSARAKLCVYTIYINSSEVWFLSCVFIYWFKVHFPSTRQTYCTRSIWRRDVLYIGEKVVKR